MTQPLALLHYEKLLPCSQLMHRLEDMGYRVQTVPEAGQLAAQAETTKPLLVIVDLDPGMRSACSAIADLQRNAATSHIPVIAIAGEDQEEAQEAARQAGAKLVVHDHAILAYLDQFLEQALEI